MATRPGDLIGFMNTGNSSSIGHRIVAQDEIGSHTVAKTINISEPMMGGDVLTFPNVYNKLVFSLSAKGKMLIYIHQLES